MIESDSLDIDYILPRLVVTVCDESYVPVLISNFSSCVLTIESGTKVALFTEVTDTQPDVVVAGMAATSEAAGGSSSHQLMEKQ